MSKPRSAWWPYMKNIIRKYPNHCTTEEKAAIERAIEITKGMEDGKDRYTVVDMVLLRKTHTIAGAALKAHICERNAQQWHADFIRLVGKEFRCEKGLF